MVLWAELCSPKKFICWSPKAQDFRKSLYLERGLLWGNSRENKVIREGPNPIRLLFLVEEFRAQAHPKGKSCEDTGRRWPSISHRERPQKSPALPAPWSQTPGPLENVPLLFKSLSLWFFAVAGWANDTFTNTGQRTFTLLLIFHKLTSIPAEL